MAKPAAGDDLGIPPPPAIGAGGAPTDKQMYIGVPNDYSIRTTQETPAEAAAKYGSHLGQIPSQAFAEPTTPTFKFGDESKLGNLPPEQLARLQGDMVRAGVIGPKTAYTLGIADNTTVNAWKEVLGIANRYGSTDPVSILGQMASSTEAQKKAALQASRYSKSTSTSTSTQYSITDPTTAHVVLRRTLEQELGRAPTEDDARQFLSALNSVERASPSTSTTTTTNTSDAGDGTSDPTSNSTSTSTSTSSVAPGAEAAADQFARAGELGKERNTYRAATDYYGAAMQALGAGGGML